MKGVWVVWSQNVGGNWDLYGRPFRNGQPGPTIRITRDVEPDLLPAMAADEGGTIWLARPPVRKRLRHRVPPAARSALDHRKKLNAHL